MGGRILHIGKYFPPHRGGMENYLADLMAAQQRLGLRPRALVHSSERRCRDRDEALRHGTETLSICRAAVWATLFFAPLAPLFLLSARRCIRRDRPAVLHLHLPNLSVFALLLLPAARRLPWVVHWHADVVSSPHSRALRLLYPLVYRPFEQAVLHRAAAIIATSPPYLDSSEALRAHRARCHVVPLGIDPQRLAAAARPPGSQSTRPAPSPAPRAAATDRAVPLRVIAVGRLTYYKGLTHLIDAVASCPAVLLTLVGDGDQAPLLRRQIAERGLQARVELAGALDDADMARAIAGADLLCLPSIERTEAFGIVLLEAMALAVPVLATCVPGAGMAWIVERSGAGRLVAPADTGALALALTELATERAMLRRLGESGQRAFREHFHIDKGCVAIAALYTQLLRNNDAS